MGGKPENKRRQDTKASPFAGCSIVIASMLAMLFLVGYVIWTLYRLDREISKFTEDEPQSLPVPVLEDRTKELNDLKARLNTFETESVKEETASLALKPADLNLAIAAFQDFADLRGKFFVKGIENERLLIDIAFPLNGKPLSGELRYLNGTMVALPRLTTGEIVLDIEEVRVAEGTVPEGFLGQFSPHRITERYKEDERLGKWLARLTEVSLTDEALVLTVAQTEEAAAPEPADMKAAAKRAILLFGLLLLLLFLTVALIVIFTKKRRALLAAEKLASSESAESPPEE